MVRAGTWYGRPGVGARVRTTIDPGPARDEGAIALAVRPGLVFCLRRPAIAPGTQPGASVTDQETDARREEVPTGDPGSRSRAE